MRNKKAQDIINPVLVVLLLVVLIVIMTAIFGSFYTIKAGQRGVLLTFGEADMNAKGEGLNFKIPLVQSVVKMDVQTQKYEAELSAASSDLQDVKTKIAINYHIVAEEAPTIYRDIGLGYADKVIYPAEQEVNKAITSKFTAEELITKRETVREDMKTLLAERLRSRGIIVEDISIVDFKFSDSFTQAIESKVTNEQNALAAKNKLEQIKYEAAQRVAQAEGESTAIKIQTEALNRVGGKDYITLKWIERWDGRVSLVSGENNPIVDLRTLNMTR